MKNIPDLLTSMDDALGAILDDPWDAPASPPAAQTETAPPPAPDTPQEASTAPPQDDPPQPLAPIMGREDRSTEARIMRTVPPVPEEPTPDDPEEHPHVQMGLGTLADLASGRKTAEEVASSVGVTGDELHAQLATALREVPQEEIQKAMGLQAVEQQLKSGAVYGAVLADLVRDMLGNRMKPETKIELAKLLARVGRIEPKEDKTAGLGSGFQLYINLGNAEPRPIVVEAEG